MFMRTAYKKLASNSRWYDDMRALSPFLIGVVRRVEPETSFDGETAAPLPAGELRHPNVEFYRGVTPPNFKNFDNSPNIESWTIVRRFGPIEFSERQIWDAVIQHQSEFRSLYQIDETRAEFQVRDPIGYSETMAGMERVLYRALGYL
jgi:hypothetical protein